MSSPAGEYRADGSRSAAGSGVAASVELVESAERVDRAGLRTAFLTVAPVAFLAVLPLAVLVGLVGWEVHTSSLGVDFRRELYPEARLVLHGHNPFPPSGSDLSGGANRAFPIPAALLVSPLLLLSASHAALVF